LKLKHVEIRDFQSIRDTAFDVGEITCLVGKNEAGKTAVLKALYRLRPIIESDAKFSVTDDYPRWDVEDYRLAVEAGEREHAIVTKATFDLDDEDVADATKLVGLKALRNRSLTLSKGYEGTSYYSLDVQEAAAIAHIASIHKLDHELVKAIKESPRLQDATKVLEAAEQTEAVKSAQAAITEVQKDKGLVAHVYKGLATRVPKFLYFDEYYQMQGRANIEALIRRKEEKKLLPSDHALLGLIDRARLDLKELLNPARTRDLKNQLEGAGNHLTKQIVKYWSQNRHLELRFDVRPGRPEDPDGMQTGSNIWSDVYDSKHRVTTELGTRSRGFVWFFSFLAWYGNVLRDNARVILLLDEPGLTLHGKAQEDLLRYFETEIKGHHQLIYSTHSPFMVDPKHFERVRIVQDLAIEAEEVPPEKEGTKVLADAMDATADSLFPLQGALGYEIYQTLFIGPNSLVVEGASDLLYIQLITALLSEKGRTGLSDQWTTTPVGGADKVPTFVALIGAQKNLNVAVLIDYQKSGRQQIENLYKKKLLQKKKVLTFTDFTNTAEADIEDMFDDDFYLALVNEEFKEELIKPISPVDLPRGGRIIVRIENYLAMNPLKNGSKEFNHFRPARRLAESLAIFGPRVSDAALARFEAAFSKLNALL
jgi:predicted ATP-dependent endonuclease of OLD family